MAEMRNNARQPWRITVNHHEKRNKSKLVIRQLSSVQSAKDHATASSRHKWHHERSRTMTGLHIRLECHKEFKETPSPISHEPHTLASQIQPSPAKSSTVHCPAESSTVQPNQVATSSHHADRLASPRSHATMGWRRAQGGNLAPSHRPHSPPHHNSSTLLSTCTRCSHAHHMHTTLTISCWPAHLDHRACHTIYVGMAPTRGGGHSADAPPLPRRSDKTHQWSVDLPRMKGRLLPPTSYLLPLTSYASPLTTRTIVMRGQ